MVEYLVPLEVDQINKLSTMVLEFSEANALVESDKFSHDFDEERTKRLIGVADRLDHKVWEFVANLSRAAKEQDMLEGDTNPIRHISYHLSLGHLVVTTKDFGD